MIMKVLLALMKDGRDHAFLMVIDYLIKENRTFDYVILRGKGP